MDKNVTKFYYDMDSFRSTSIDIVIPYYRHYNSVLRAIRSIFSVPNKNKIKIILVDDCSENVAFLESFEKNEYVDGYRMPEHSGFGASVNYGISKCTAPWILVCHSDIEAKYAGWIDYLVEDLISWKKIDNTVKMISATSDRFNDDYDKRLKLLDPIDSKSFILNTHSPFYATLFHRDLPKHIDGYLFKEYPYAWYEDIELHHRMKFYGFKQSGCLKSCVKHYDGTTINSLINLQNGREIGEVMESNYDKCLKDISSYVI